MVEFLGPIRRKGRYFLLHLIILSQNGLTGTKDANPLSVTQARNLSLSLLSSGFVWNGPRDSQDRIKGGHDNFSKGERWFH